MASPFSGLELLATAVVALDDELVVRYANPAAESLFATGAKSLIGHPFLGLFSEREELERALGEARVSHWDYSAQNITYARPGREPIPLSCVITRIDAEGPRPSPCACSPSCGRSRSSFARRARSASFRGSSRTAS